MTKKIYKAIGLMSGTSMDGIDLALIESDGESVIHHLASDYLPYDRDFVMQLSNLIYGKPSLRDIKILENEQTMMNAVFVNEFLKKNNIDKSEIDVIGFHGHTIYHDPSLGVTWQIGNNHLLAAKTNIDVISDFRASDVANGGQGAPLVPIYHFYLLERSAAVLNIGGISNITSFVEGDESSLEAFDVCFGNAPLDDLMRQKMRKDFDNNGEIAKRGTVNLDLAKHVLQHEIFHRKPPKSFDRDDFSEVTAEVYNLKLEDALATLSYIHAEALAINIGFLSHRPTEIFVCGGGRKNHALMSDMMKSLKDIKVRSIDELGFNGDTVEAEAFAFLAIRSLKGLPISFAKTTGANMREGRAKAMING